MPENPESREDVHVHNVSWHRGGREEHGTLSLTAHHLTFSYVPCSKNGQPSTASDGATGSKRSASKPKVLWVPYPMINRCTLRPSHAQSGLGSNQIPEHVSNGAHDAEELFPPTYGTGYERPSTDSARLAPYSSPRHPASPNPSVSNDTFGDSIRPPTLRLRCRDFQMMAFHFHASSAGKSPDDSARQVFFTLRGRCCLDKVESMLAFHFHPPQEEKAVGSPTYDARREFARMGIGGKAAEGPGSAWRITDINQDYSFSATYPSVLCVPRTVSDNMLKYGGAFRSRSRIPALAYLHFNGGSITRSSQPLVGVQGKRNPQDERLVSAIFSSHTPPLGSPEDSPVQVPSLTSASTTTLESSISDPATLDEDVTRLTSSHSETALDEIAAESAAPPHKRVYGSTRRNLIADARPKINALANKATGGGIEDVSNYTGASGAPIEKIFLNIQNIHVMRSSLEKIIESMANSDYVGLAPDQEALRKSGWLGHIAGLLEGSALVARVVGLAGSHVLIHCSDGWDRTSQVSALAQVMLDPHYRTLDGFITLVQKDFLSFGHKFRDRNGILGSEKWFEIENERIAPSRAGDSVGSDAGSLNALGSKALTGARNWFEKNRGSLFRQANTSQGSLADPATSRPASPPPNPIIHSPAQPTNKEDKAHKTSEKEIAPIFHQFLDAVHQLQRQYPHAFQFNERFLLRLLYHAYSGQYGEFLFNCEKERIQHRTPSVWQYFLARRPEFLNPEYSPKAEEALLLPKRGSDQQIEVRWWSKLFGRKEEEMNVPRALAPADPSFFIAQPPVVSLDDDGAHDAERARMIADPNGPLKEASKSTPTLNKMTNSIASSFSNMSMQSSTANAEPAAAAPKQRPAMTHNETDLDVLAKYSGASPPSAAPLNDEASKPQAQPMEMEDEGDPLGVTGSTSYKASSGGLDFAAFASQNAFRDR